MPRSDYTPIEEWAVRSKPRAFGFLLGLALLISVCLTVTASLLATIATHGVLPLAAASTP